MIEICEKLDKSNTLLYLEEVCEDEIKLNGISQI